MQRMGMVIGLKPEKVAEYKRLHAAVWPEVLDMISKCNIRNYSIFLKEPENLLFGYWEYHGTDFAADAAKMAADPKTQEWWDVCMPCQEPFETRGEGEWWAMMEEVFHHD
ncbi:L-rhamnose mutarotase [Oricola thermophila]|uniref:L-rhamnose mutarotase n=1 Tax=Oricola thermophila TaxID=2742145 RepID=A0A6N1VIA1_9HYPH|nr:L-rhamnose mutarotase [Oricola thermophila]QKV19072.1 L-rhamnose mutarotase [Oricola thermophila]